MNNTNDLAGFGTRELEIAFELLKAYADCRFCDGEDNLGKGVKIEFNPHSGYVFLVDDDYNVVMLNDNNELELYLSCSNCGYENLRSDFDWNDKKCALFCPECQSEI